VVRRDLGGGGGGGDGEEPFPLAAAAAPGGAVAASGEREARGAFWPFPSAIGGGRREVVSRGRARVCSRPLGFHELGNALLAEVVASVETGVVGTRPASTCRGPNKG
jgi:hypothetical protein